MKFCVKMIINPYYHMWIYNHSWLSNISSQNLVNSVKFDNFSARFIE